MRFASPDKRRSLAACSGYAAAVLFSLLVVPVYTTGLTPNPLAAVIGLAVASERTWKFNTWSASWLRELRELGIGAAAIGAIWVFAFGLPWSVLWFAPAWLGLSVLVRLAPRLMSPVERLVVPAVRFCVQLAIRGAVRLGPGLAPFLTSVVPVALGYLVLAALLPGFALGDHQALVYGAAAWGLIWAGLCAFMPSWLGSRLARLAPLASAALLVGFAGGVHRSTLVWIVWSAAGVVAARAAAWRRDEGGQRAPARESCRLALVVLGASLLMKGFLSRATLGAGDARWYATMLQDMVLQVRAHGFPVWTGQTPYQFNGSIYPLRVAPAFHHLGALLDLLTFRVLPTVSLMNLLIFVVGLAAALVTYFAAASVLPSRRLAAALLSLLYLACPGVLGVAYNTDLYMSWMTIPFVPLALIAVLRNVETPLRVQTLVLSGALGLCWWGHSPIALWTTAAAGLIQLYGILKQRPAREGWIHLGCGAALFLAIAAYPIGSVLVYPPEDGVNAADFQRALPGNIENFLHQVFPQVLLPMSPLPQVLSNFQLGYALWILLLAAVVLAVRGRLERAAKATLAVAVALVVLLTPFPGWHDGLWTFVPAFFRNTTGNWVMNRLYVVLAASILATLAAVIRSLPKRSYRGALCLLAAGAAWSLCEASKFSPLLPSQLTGWQTSEAMLRPENIMVTRFAYLVFPMPPATFSDGVVAPELEYRLLDRSSLAPLADGLAAAAAAGRPVAAYDLTSSFDPQWLGIGSPLHLEGGKRYLLEIDPKAGAARPTGVLQIKGPSLFRENLLPSYGGDLAFGYGEGHTPYEPIWTSLPGGEDTRVIFVAQDMTPAQADHFAQVRLIEYDPARVPVQVTGWMPYQASVEAGRASWLESPRSYQSGYVATVDGAPAEVRKSPIGLAMVAVPQGRSNVVLRYAAPFGLQALFWGSVLAIALSLAAGARHLARGRT